MSHSESETSRTDPDFGWVADLPTYSYTGLLPISTSSLLPKFSLFSLFRSTRPALPRADQLEPLLNLPFHSANPPSIRDTIKGLNALSDYVTLLKTSCVGLDERRAEEAEQWVLRAMEGYLIAIALVSHATFDASDSDTQALGATVSQSLRGLFTIHAHYVGSSRPEVTSWLDKITSNLLATPFAHLEADEANHHLVPLFTQTRDIIRNLQNAARASHTKAAAQVGLTGEDEVGKWDMKAGERMEWLRLCADHVRGLEGLAVTVKKDNEHPVGNRITKKATLLAQKEDQERPMRIAIEADLLRCDLAISMATAKIGEIKRRARAGIAVASGQEGEVKAEEVKEEGQSRKRRALTDESDLETVVPDQAEWEPIIACTDDNGGRRWEEDVDMALLETLRKVREILEEKHSEVLIAKIDRSDWLEDPSSSSNRRRSLSPSKVTTTPGGTRNPVDNDEASSSSESSQTSDSSDDEDLSHSCPLRTLFRLHDRYEEQRLAVWLSLPSDGRGKMGAYMRGVEGRVGSAWDAVGLRLLMELDNDALEAYGLSPDKHDKWVELASRRNTKKIRKKGRKTV